MPPWVLSNPLRALVAGGAAAEERPRTVHRRFLPRKALISWEGGTFQESMTRWVPFLQSFLAEVGRATAYLCVNRAHRAPAADPRVFEDPLRSFAERPG